MKNILFLFAVCSFAFTFRAFSQTVYVNQTGTSYHTKSCKFYTKNFEAVPLWQAKNALGKKPCPKCKPPIKETGPGKKPVKKKPAPAPLKPTAAPVKK